MIRYFHIVFKNNLSMHNFWYILRFIEATSLPSSSSVGLWSPLPRTRNPYYLAVTSRSISVVEPIAGGSLVNKSEVRWPPIRPFSLYPSLRRASSKLLSVSFGEIEKHSFFWNDNGLVAAASLSEMCFYDFLLELHLRENFSVITLLADAFNHSL